METRTGTAFDEHYTLIEKGDRLVRQSVVSVMASHDRIQRSRTLAADSQSWNRQHRRRWTAALAAVIGKKLRDGCLPSEPPLRIIGGPGTGHRCVVCEGKLRPTHLMVELLANGNETLLMHGDCFANWNAALGIGHSGGAIRSVRTG